ncbi:HEAT repeat domain-containing protein [Marispirochaeta aestuarii]|uniref:HEAT repeat domain-containing protein n=1 Tax=Marispirochaeta aestuarii TaxID=1963862 RepID=UPI0029C8C9BE|nr:HEAT repeat domain-containing protein [Marispirochaeta aestuarii]
MMRMGILVFLLFSQPFFTLPMEGQTTGNPEENRDDDQRRDILRYGIDSEVISLLKDLEDDEDIDDFTEEIMDLLVNSRNQELKAAAVRIFSSVEYRPALEQVEKILLDYPDKEELIIAGIEYFIELDHREGVEILKDFTSSQQTAVAMKAVEGIGRLGDPGDIQFLRDLYDDTSLGQNVRASALSALGMLKDSESIPFLEEIVTDASQERSYRWRACQALGEIGTPEVLPVLADLLNDDDTILRTYAVRALTTFESGEVLDYLMEALRDSFWRVRLAAVETLGERKEKDAIDILVYKATRDPEERIRIAAIQALGKIGGRSYRSLRDLAGNQRYSQASRIVALQELVKNDLGNSFGLIDTILEKEEKQPGSRIFIELVKAMSQEENPRLADYFERFLTHGDVSVVLMALKGIGENRFSGLRDKVQTLSESNTSSSIKKAAEEALEKL